MQDETETGTQDTPQPGAGQSSGDGTGTTPAELPKTFTESEVQKAVNDALAKAGREAKALELRKVELEKEKTEHTAWLEERKKAEKERDEAEAERLKDKPEELSIYQRQKRLREAEAALVESKQAFEAERLTHAERIKAVEETERETTVFEIATELNGDPVILKATAGELNLTSNDQIKALAKRLWPPAKKEAPPGTKNKPDSGETGGGGGKLTNEQIEKMSSEEYAAHPSVKGRYK